MRILLRLFGLLLCIGVAWWAIQMVAAESGEVVIVTTTDAEGRPHQTRLWIVDHDHAGWLRAGSERAGWYRRLSAAPEVRLRRNDQTASYVARSQPWELETINRLMAEKYGWAEWYISLVVDRDQSIPVRLEIPDD